MEEMVTKQIKHGMDGWYITDPSGNPVLGPFLTREEASEVLMFPY